MEHVIAIILAYIIDLIIGDPRSWPHPVKWFGRAIQLMEKWWNRGNYRKGKGLLMLIILMSITFSGSIFFIFLAYRIHPFMGIFVEAMFIATTIAQKSLKDASLLVYEPLEKGDLITARNNLAEIVGRDTNSLSEEAIVRGTVETVAENTSDGITAPLFWAFIGGAPLALVYRAVNTCDSMVGYKNERYHDFGFASAKCDDLLNYIPARLTAIVMLLINKNKDEKFGKLWSYIRTDAKKHASPNSGWLEATVAYLLHVQLGGINFYNGIRAESAIIGTLSNINSYLHKNHIKQTIRIMERTIIASLILIIVGGIFIEITFTWF